MRFPLVILAIIAFLAMATCVLLVLPSANKAIAQDQPDASEYVHDHLYAETCLPPNMPVFGNSKDIKGWNTFSYKIEFDCFANSGGTCTIMARIMEETGQFHVLEDIHWHDYPNWTPPYPDSLHFILTGTGTTNGNVKNRLEWLVQPFCTEPAYFRHCHVWVTYGPL